MNQKLFSLTAGVIFSLIAMPHILRIVFEWEAIIGGWAVPPYSPQAPAFRRGQFSLNSQFLILRHKESVSWLLRRVIRVDRLNGDRVIGQ